MPTDKPYTIAVRLKQHDKPTRRVPPEDTDVGEAAITIVSASLRGAPDDMKVRLSHHDGLYDHRVVIAMWLALGVHLVDHCTDAFHKFFFQTVLGVAASALEDPARLLALQQAVGASMLEVFGEAEVGEAELAAIVEQAKKTSTEGSN